MRKKIWWLVIGGVMIASMLLAACQPQTIIETVTVETIKEVQSTVEVEKVVTATPQPEATAAPEAVSSFDQVPDSVLMQVCEDVKSAVEYDDDARTLTLHLVAPFAPVMQLLSNGWASPLDMEWMVENGAWDGDCADWAQYHDPSAEDTVLFNQENGTGPFVLEHWRPGDEISAVRNENYWRTEPMWEGGPSGPAFYERVVEKNVEEWGTRFAMFGAGDADSAYVPRQYIEQIDPLVGEECDYKTDECEKIGSGQFRRYKGMSGGTVSVDFFFAMDIPQESSFIGSGKLDGSGIPSDFFADVNIRKAFASCFDYDTYIRDVAKGEAIQRNGPIPPDYPGYDANDPPAPEFDPAAGEEYFKAADLDHDGIPAGEDDDGDVWNTGFFMMMAYNTGNDQRRVAAELLKANIEAINENFRVDVLGLPWPAYLKQQRAGYIPLYRIGWMEDYHHPHNWVQPFLSDAGAYGYALGLPADLQAEFNSMIAKAKGLVDPAEQDAAYKDIQRMAAEYQTSMWGIQPTARHYEPLWMQGWFYNPSFPCPFVYGLSESDDSPDPSTFVDLSIGDPETFDPAYMYDTASSCWVWRLYDPLIHVKRERYDEFVGQLADTWDISDDGLTYTFHIRDGVKFHQGGDLDAHDAAYALWRGMLQDRVAGPQWMFWDAFFSYETVEGYAMDQANAALGTQ